MEDEEIKKYINVFYIENELRKYETLILEIMKKRQEYYPSDENDKEWLDYSNLFSDRWIKINERKAPKKHRFR
jgi:hypothetical protein